MTNHKYYYRDNNSYEKFLTTVNVSLYWKYINRVLSCFNENGGKFLDVGCGIGTVIHQIYKNNKKVDAYGIDVSNNFINRASKGKGTFKIYNGNKIPFRSNSFDVVGCFTVLEHVANPIQLLHEMVRVVKKSGYIIISGPNFLRVFGFSAVHPRTRGLLNPIKNLFIAIDKYIQTIFCPGKIHFRFMNPIVSETVQADYDAICETNMIDVRHFLKKNGIRMLYQSGLVDTHKLKVVNIISEIPILRDLTGGYFIMGVKEI